MSRGLFLTGTGTDIGKTYIAGLMLKKLHEGGKRAAYYKAAMSGNNRRPDGSLSPGDALFVKKMSGIAQPLAQMCPYVYEQAVSPHLAARLEGRPVELKTVLQGYAALCSEYDFITVEGSGGILCPIRMDEETIWLEDIVKALGLSCVIAAAAGLGTINSVVLTADYMKRRGLRVKGLIFDHFHPGDVMEEDNIKVCEKMTGLKTLATVKDGDTELDMDLAALCALYE